MSSDDNKNDNNQSKQASTNVKKQKQPSFIEKQFVKYGLSSIHVPAGLLLFNGFLWVEWLSILVLSVRYQPLRRLMRTQPRMVRLHNNLHQYRTFTTMENWVTGSADKLSTNRYFLKIGRYLNTTPDNLTYATIETIVIYNAGLIFLAPINFVASVMILHKWFGHTNDDNNSNNNNGNNSDGNDASSATSGAGNTNNSHNNNVNSFIGLGNEKVDFGKGQLTIGFGNILDSNQRCKDNLSKLRLFSIATTVGDTNNNNTNNDLKNNNNSNIFVNNTNKMIQTYFQINNINRYNDNSNENSNKTQNSNNNNTQNRMLLDISQYPFDIASMLLTPLFNMKTKTYHYQYYSNYYDRYKLNYLCALNMKPSATTQYIFDISKKTPSPQPPSQQQQHTIIPESRISTHGTYSHPIVNINNINKNNHRNTHSYSIDCSKMFDKFENSSNNVNINSTISVNVNNSYSKWKDSCMNMGNSFYQYCKNNIFSTTTTRNRHATNYDDISYFGQIKQKFSFQQQRYSNNTATDSHNNNTGNAPNDTSSKQNRFLSLNRLKFDYFKRD